MELVEEIFTDVAFVAQEFAPQIGGHRFGKCAVCRYCGA